MPYVSRDGSNVINGLYANLQPGYAEEFLADDNAEVLAYVAAKSAGGALLSERQREAARQLVELIKTPDGRVLRAIVALLVDGDTGELNRIFDRFREQDAVVAAATSLANLKSGWAAMSSANPMPDRTMSQAITAVKNKITGNA